jgi:hypothetical protein
MKHKHYDCIVAWAGGAEIEVLYETGWTLLEQPFWTEENQYRVKPEPTLKTVKLLAYIHTNDYQLCWFGEGYEPHKLLKRVPAEDKTIEIEV